MKEIGNYIFKSAALCHPLNGITFEGRRHHEIIADMVKKGFTPDFIRDFEQGFIVTHEDYPFDGYFITRDEATEIAQKNKFSMIGSILTSEDLW